jgi:hypothetical protein
VTKVAKHRHSVWLKGLVSGKSKGRYHVDHMELWLEREGHQSSGEDWMSVATMNKQTKKAIMEWMRKTESQRKKMMNERGLDSTDYKEDDRSDVPDSERSRDVYPQGYGDEEAYAFWKGKAVDLQRPFQNWRRV